MAKFLSETEADDLAFNSTMFLQQPLTEDMSLDESNTLCLFTFLLFLK